MNTSSDQPTPEPLGVAVLRARILELADDLDQAGDGDGAQLGVLEARICAVGLRELIKDDRVALTLAADQARFAREIGEAA